MHIVGARNSGGDNNLVAGGVGSQVEAVVGGESRVAEGGGVGDRLGRGRDADGEIVKRSFMLNCS